MSSACQADLGRDVNLEGEVKSRFENDLVLHCVELCCAVWATKKAWNHFRPEGVTCFTGWLMVLAF